MKRLLSFLIAFVMVLGIVPLAVLTVLAQEPAEAEETSAPAPSSSEPVTITNGEYSLTVNKTQFDVGEPILVSGSALSTNDWIGIYDPRGNGSIRYGYPSSHGAGVEFNLREGTLQGSHALGDIPEGEYIIRLMPNGTSNLDQAKALVKIRVGNPPAISGDSTKMSMEKRVFKVGEAINVSAYDDGTGAAWVGIIKSGVTSSSLYHYPKKVGEGVAYDVCQGRSFPAGAYVIALVPNNQAYSGSELIAYTSIVITDEHNYAVEFEETVTPGGGNEGGTTDPDNPGGGETPDPDPDNPSGGETTDPEDPEQGGDAAVSANKGELSLGVNKSRYEYGESIWVTATGVRSKDWVGIAPRGYTEGTIRWYYIASAGNGVPYDVRQAPNLAGSLNAYADTPEGLYTIYLIENDSYLKNGFTISINIAVGDVDDPDNGKITVSGAEEEPTAKPSAPTSATYDINDSTSGYAAGTVTVTMPSDQLTDRAIVMYWADANGILEGYTAHARFKVTGETTTFTFTDSMIIPQGATRLLVYAQNTSAELLSDECISIDLPQGAQAEITGDPNTSFFIISDIHIGKNGSAERFKKMLSEAIALKPNGTAIFIVGDMADNGYASQFADMVALHKEVMDANGKDVADYPLFLTLGNHDYPAMTGTFLEYATLPDGTHPTKTSYDFWLDGYHYIFLGSDANSGLYATLGEETLAWLDQKLNECRDPSRPTFVFLHQPMYNTVSGSLLGENWNGVNNEEALRAVLKKYPEVVMFNGHTHWTMDSKGNIFEGTEDLPIHIFNCASVSYLWSGFNTITGEDLAGSQGYFIEIYNGQILVRGRDFANSAWIPAAQYLVEMTGEAAENGGHILEKTVSYPSGYLASGTVTYACACNQHSNTQACASIFTFSGYSYSTFNTSGICVGYTVNREMLAEIGSEMVIGFVASPYDTLVNEGCPINADGTVGEVTGGKVLSYVLDSTTRQVDLILRAKDWTRYADNKTVLCLYIIENGNVGYICNESQITEKAEYITYSSIVKD